MNGREGGRERVDAERKSNAESGQTRAGHSQCERRLERDDDQIRCCT